MGLALVLAIKLCLNLSMAKNAKGERGGNGGGVWVCKNQDAIGSIRKVELVDFYEAEKEFKYTLKEYPGMDEKSILDSYKQRILELDKNLAASLEPYFSKLESKINPVDTDLEIIDDALFRVRPPQRWCENGVIKYEQMANYTDYGSILMNQFLYSHVAVSNAVRAGVKVHEVVYEYFRDKFRDKDSVRARRMVGVIASTLDTEGARKEYFGRIPNAYGMEFVKIANGSFVMGSPIEEVGRDFHEAQVSVNITKDFYIMTTEVTQLQYFKVMGLNPSSFKSKNYCPESFTIINNVALCPNNPVEKVSRSDVQLFLEKLNSKQDGSFYRLPTEAEWEYAARAGSTTPYFYGNDNINKYSWYLGNSKGMTHAVGVTIPNKNGLYDTQGNVWEMVQDSYPVKKYGKHVTQTLPGGIDPVVLGGTAGVARGGSFAADLPFLRTAKRHYDYACNNRYWDLGFRLVKNL
jgi:formylglycine-generating enzyme required for sulfatase activity